MADVFISYARNDEAVARRVAKALQSAGRDVWWDADLPAHRAYSEEIERNLEAAKVVVVLWSKTAAKSQWVRAEADFARNAGKLVQATVDGALPPMPFNQVQCADLKGWRGAPKQHGWVKLKASVDAVLRGEEPPAAVGTTRPKRSLIPRWAAAIAAVAILAIGALLLVPRFTAERAEQPRLAVLPFASLSASDQPLVEGIWEDTRQALSRNPQLIVLGPNSSRELAKKKSAALRKAADYLLDGTVRTAGKQIRFTTALVRTKDGAQIWSATFNRNLDDVFALQTELATEVEGRIRGRLARSGGVKPEHIATSGEVYALYSSARAKLRARRFQSGKQVLNELRQVVKMDPNFAPGWATLSVAEKIYGSAVEGPVDDPNQPEKHARRAIALAPNLASGHAALAFALNLDGSVAESELRRAIKLDPNDVEPLNWLGNLLNNQGKISEAFRIYSKATEIEPLWWPIVLNKLGILIERRDFAAAQKERDRVKALGAERLATQIEMDILSARHDYSEAVRMGINFYKRGSAEDRDTMIAQLAGLLSELGMYDEGVLIGSFPPFVPLLAKQDPRGIAMFDALKVPPERFWSELPMPIAMGRVYVISGRHSSLVRKYDGIGASPQKVRQLTGSDYAFASVAPILAVALERSGRRDDAAKLLALGEAAARQARKDRASNQPVYLARIYAAQGRNHEALKLLARAFDDGWFPISPELPTDLALDPPMVRFKGNPTFEQIRKRILTHIAKERAELGPVTLN